MSDSYQFNSVSHFTAGTQGEPGNRLFFLQLCDTEHHVSVKLEKQQVQALAHYLRGVLEDLPSLQPNNDLGPVQPIDPVFPEWVVGQIAVGVSEDGAEVVLVIEELVIEADDDAEGPSVQDDLFAREDQGARIRAHIDVEQAARFVETATELVRKGRPPCRLCGQPMDRGGHICPRWN